MAVFRNLSGSAGILRSSQDFVLETFLFYYVNPCGAAFAIMANKRA